MNTFSFYQRKKTQTGLTMVEIMVAITISLILMAGVSQLYLANKQTYRTTDAMSRLQENGRFALNFLVREIRAAGNMGCLNLETMDVTNWLDEAGTDYDVDLHSFSDGVDGTNGAEDANSALDDPDTLVLKGVDDGGATVGTPYMTTQSAALHVNTPNNLSNCQVVLVSDCQKGDIFQITSVNPDTNGTVDHNKGNACDPGNKGSNPHKLSKTYDSDASIFALSSKTFSIQNGLSGRPGLFFDAGTGAGAQELVEGVENMQILFGIDGIDSDTVPDYYVPWSGALDMSNVVSIRVSLLLSTMEDNITDQSQTYQYNVVVPARGGTTTAADRRLRKVFTATVAIRNRLK